MNPCPCGYFGDPLKPCTCALGMVHKYQKRISGPLMDRIDIHIEVPRLDYDKLTQQRLGESSVSIRERVEKSRKIQIARFNENQKNPPLHSNHKFIYCNAEMSPTEIRKYCILDDDSNNLMRTAMKQLQLSARAYHRILKLARTIADLADSANIRTNHIAEALQYRPKLNLEP